jgi:hypothetical protein
MFENKNSLFVSHYFPLAASMDVDMDMGAAKRK